MGAMTLLITGAGGFVGGACVAAALAAGHRVKALARRPGAAPAGAEEVVCDLSDPGPVLTEALTNVDAVIHAAAIMGGDDAAHIANTVTPTVVLIDAMEAAGAKRLVLVSSLSVYGYASLPTGAMLDELTPPEPDPAMRDSYARGKLGQEAASHMAARRGLHVRCLRPGMIYGPGRLWSARLGLALGPVAVMLGGRAALPLTHVTHTAAALVRAAEADLAVSDLKHLPDGGYWDAINVIADQQPSQKEYLSAMRALGWPKLVLPVPLGLLEKASKLVSLVGAFTPGLMAKLPGILRPESLHARAKPLRFSTARMHDRLGPIKSPDFREAVRAAKTE